MATIWNSADKGANLFIGNHGVNQVTVNSPATYQLVRATTAIDGGRFSFDILALRNETVVGFVDGASSTTGYVGQTATGWGFLISGVVYNNNAILQSGFGQVQTYDRLTSIYDHDSGEIIWQVNGVTVYTASSVSGTLYPAISHRNGGIACAVFTGFGATITLSSGAIVDAAGSPVTETGVIFSVQDRATGAQLATTTANVSAGAATLNFTADVTNGQSVLVQMHNASGTLKAGGLLATVSV